jgi:hypothetical protein
MPILKWPYTEWPLAYRGGWVELLPWILQCALRHQLALILFGLGTLLMFDYLFPWKRNCLLGKIPTKTPTIYWWLATDSSGRFGWVLTKENSGRGVNITHFTNLVFRNSTSTTPPQKHHFCLWTQWLPWAHMRWWYTLHFDSTSSQDGSTMRVITIPADIMAVHVVTDRWFRRQETYRSWYRWNSGAEIRLERNTSHRKSQMG